MERKRAFGIWLWVVVALVVLAAVGFYLWYAGYIQIGSMTDSTRPVVAGLGTLPGGRHGA